jgi:hypothetical protein
LKPLVDTGVKIALAEARFSWFRGGPARAMVHCWFIRSIVTINSPEPVPPGENAA